MTPDACAFIAELCAARAGLKVDPDKSYLIESRLAPVARRENFASVADLVGALRQLGDEPLVKAAVEAMAPSETSFFRDRAVFEHLWREVVPELARRSGDGVVRIWSAGCAAGQEIYSLAMLQAEAPAPTGKVEFFASDLSESALERARAGIYSSFEIQRGLTARQLVRHFDNRDERFQLVRSVRQAVRWRRVNLLDDLAPIGAFDIVLCRYVLGTLTEEASRHVLTQLAGAVAPGGVLVLGEGEGAASSHFTPFPASGGLYTRDRDISAAA
jgi:chemotaxis protein methyltransferase CheR